MGRHLKKVHTLNEKSNQYREIVIQGIEKLIMDIRDGKIEHLIIGTLDADHVLDRIVYNDRPQQSLYPLVGVVRHLERELLDDL
jgi:hypothetical protein